MIWPDGVTYISDGFMYSGAAQLIQTGVFQANATPSGTANNAPPYGSIDSGPRRREHRARDIRRGGGPRRSAGHGVRPRVRIIDHAAR